MQTMRKLVYATAIWGVFIAAAPAFADKGISKGDRILSVQVATNGKATIDLENGDSTRRNSCVTRTTRFAFRITDDIGKAFLKLAIAAQLSGAAVTVWGTGACTLSSIGEDLLQLGLGE